MAVVGPPHAPGYLCYVLLGRAAAALTGSAEQWVRPAGDPGHGAGRLGAVRPGPAAVGTRASAGSRRCCCLPPRSTGFTARSRCRRRRRFLTAIVSATLCWRVWRGETRSLPCSPCGSVWPAGCASKRWCFCCRWPRGLLAVAAADHPALPGDPDPDDAGLAASPAAPERGVDARTGMLSTLTPRDLIGKRRCFLARGGTDCTAT